MVKGVCVAKVGHVWQGGGMYGKRGRHAWYACPPLLRDTAGQCAGGTHPTGMHSCIDHKIATQKAIIYHLKFMLCMHYKITVHGDPTLVLYPFQYVKMFNHATLSFVNHRCV